MRVSGGDLCEAEAPTEAAAEKRVSGGDLCEAEAPTEAAAETILPYFKGVECNMTVRVSGGDLCEAEAPTEAAAETKDASKMSAPQALPSVAQFVERDSFSGSQGF